MKKAARRRNVSVAAVRKQYLKLIERYAYAYESRKLVRMNATHEALEKFETQYNLAPDSRRDAINYLKRTRAVNMSLQHALDSIDDFLRGNPAGTGRWNAVVSDIVTLPGRRPQVFERNLSVMAASESQARKAVRDSGVPEKRIIRVERGVAENPSGKESWQMTLAEYSMDQAVQRVHRPEMGDLVEYNGETYEVGFRRDTPPFAGQLRLQDPDTHSGSLKVMPDEVRLVKKADHDYGLGHFHEVKLALAHRKPVPPEVLADYPGFERSELYHSLTTDEKMRSENPSEDPGTQRGKYRIVSSFGGRMLSSHETEAQAHEAALRHSLREPVDLVSPGAPFEARTLGHYMGGRKTNPTAGGFDVEAWEAKEKAISDRVKKSKLFYQSGRGFEHLDQAPWGVEYLRGRTVTSLRDASTGTIQTVDNRGTAYVRWLDKASALHNSADPDVRESMIIGPDRNEFVLATQAQVLRQYPVLASRAREGVENPNGHASISSSWTPYREAFIKKSPYGNKWLTSMSATDERGETRMMTFSSLESAKAYIDRHEMGEGRGNPHKRPFALVDSDARTPSGVGRIRGELYAYQVNQSGYSRDIGFEQLAKAAETNFDIDKDVYHFLSGHFTSYAVAFGRGYKEYQEKRLGPRIGNPDLRILREGLERYSIVPSGRIDDSFVIKDNETADPVYRDTGRGEALPKTVRSRTTGLPLYFGTRRQAEDYLRRHLL